jgi:transposase
MFKLFEHRCKYRERLEEMECRFSEIEKLVIDLKEQMVLQEERHQQIQAAQQARIEELEARLAKYEDPPKDSSNSSIPPSQDPHRRRYPKKEKSGRSAGGQKGHPGHHHPWSHTPDEIIPLHPQTCAHCGSGDFFLLPGHQEARQEVEVPKVQAHVKEYQRYEGICQHCGQRNQAVFPEHLKAPVQMGNSIDALAGYLKVGHHASHDKIAIFFRDILGIPFSHGGVQAALKRLSSRLKPEYQGLIELCRNQAVLHSDETTSRIGTQSAYFWVFVAKSVCVFVSDKTRSFQVILRTIGEAFNGTWVSDRYGAQLKIKAKRRQLCLAHLIRDCEYLIDAERSSWGFQLKSLLQKAIQVRNQAGENWNPLEPPIQTIIRQLQGQLDDLFLKPPRRKKSKRLFTQLSKRKHHIFTFLEDPDIPPTNNEAERAIRRYVIHRRVNGNFKTSTGAEDHAILNSMIESARRQGKDILQVLSLQQSLLHAT